MVFCRGGPLKGDAEDGALRADFQQQRGQALPLLAGELIDCYRMEDAEGRLGWSFGSHFRQQAQRVSGKHCGALRSGDVERLVETADALVMLRPDQRPQPENRVGISCIHRIEVDAHAERYIGQPGG